MNKTSVYLGEADLARLRRLQEATGRSQSELLREGIRALAGDGTERSHPGSLGIGSWPVEAEGRWDAEELTQRRGV